MPLRLEFRRYALPFLGPVRTAHGTWAVREGVLLRLEHEDGRVGWGEAAPVPGFGSESVAESADFLRALGNRVDAVVFDSVPQGFPCLRRALGTVTETLGRDGEEARPREPWRRGLMPAYLPVAALLPAGKPALALAPARVEAGFRTFKWKVGVGDVMEELGLLDELCGCLPEGARLRLDANGAWDRRTAERWLARCAERPVEFVEQPVFAGAKVGEGARCRELDLLLGLAGDFPTPIALDESIAGDGDVERWIGVGWPGVFVIKPSLHGDLPRALGRLDKAEAPVVFSSALETAVGAKSALFAAFGWASVGAKVASPLPPDLGTNPAASARTASQRPARALGFGVWPLFADSRCDGPQAAPFLYLEDVERLNPEAVWNALA